MDEAVLISIPHGSKCAYVFVTKMKEAIGFYGNKTSMFHTG
jgi:hypothetical protein